MNKTMTHRFAKRLHLFVIAALLAAALGISPVPVAHAATINVAAGEVAINDNDICSLREAIENANDGAQTHDDCGTGSGGGDTINLAASSTYTLTDKDNDTDGPNGLPSITSQITINGNGSTIRRDPSYACPEEADGDGSKDFRIFHVRYDGDLTLNDLTVSNGCPYT